MRAKRYLPALALVTVVNRLSHLDFMEPVFKDCATDTACATLSEGFVGKADIDSLLWRYPATAARVPGPPGGDLPERLPSSPVSGLYRAIPSCSLSSSGSVVGYWQA